MLVSIPHCCVPCLFTLAWFFIAITCPVELLLCSYIVELFFSSIEPVFVP